MQSASAYPTPDDTRLAELAGRQYGVVSRAQLVELGYTSHAIHTRSTTGRLHRIHRGVYAVGHTRLGYRGQWLGAVLACGPGTQLSHPDGAALHDLRSVPTGGLIHVTALTRHKIDGIRCHGVRHLDPEDATTVEGIPVTTVARTLLDLAEVVTTRRLQALLEQAQRLDKLDLAQISATIARNPGRRGIAPLTAAVAELQGDDEPPWTQSELERRFRELAQAHGLPAPAFNVVIEGELPDVVWARQRVIVEVDGWLFHRSRRSFEDDRRRDAKLTTAGWHVLRFTFRRLRTEPALVAGQVRTLLRRAVAA